MPCHEPWGRQCDGRSRVGGQNQLKRDAGRRRRLSRGQCAKRLVGVATLPAPNVNTKIALLEREPGRGARAAESHCGGCCASSSASPRRFSSRCFKAMLENAVRLLRSKVRHHVCSAEENAFSGTSQLHNVSAGVYAVQAEGRRNRFRTARWQTSIKLCAQRELLHIADQAVADPNDPITKFGRARTLLGVADPQKRTSFDWRDGYLSSRKYAHLLKSR